MLRIHYFQHVEFEGIGSIEEWISMSGHSVSSTRFYINEKLPVISEIDWLIVMGGPMSVHEENKFPWLIEEKKFIRQAILEGKMVMGICLGSQLISESLGARVYKNSVKEIGWYDIDFTSMAKEDNLFSGLTDKQKVFHWHGDTFDLPEKAILLASSEGCRNQAYRYKKNVLALQYHLETTELSLRKLIQNCRSDISRGRFVQTEDELIKQISHSEANKRVLFTLLDRIAVGN